MVQFDSDYSGAGQRVKPEAQAAEGSLDAPEVQKPTQVGSCLAGRFRKMQEPVDTEYSSTASPAMQGSVETRSASQAQPEKQPRGASREVHGRSRRRVKQPVQTGSGASRGAGDSQAGRSEFSSVDPKHLRKIMLRGAMRQNGAFSRGGLSVEAPVERFDPEGSKDLKGSGCRSEFYRNGGR